MYLTLVAKPQVALRRSLSGCMSGCGSSLGVAPVVYAKRRRGRVVLHGLGCEGDDCPDESSEADVAGGGSGDSGDSGGKSGGFVNDLNKLATAFNKTKSGDTSSGNKNAANGKSSGNSASNWLAQQSNTTLAIGGTAAFALLLAIAG